LIVDFVSGVESMPYDVEAIRKRLKQSMGGKFNDPDQFRPDNAKSATEPLKYRFFVLPPLMKGDVLKSGTVENTMDQFFIAHADHWIHNKPTPCPRVWDNSDCPICTEGFDLLKDETDEETRRAIVKQWMPTTYYMVNVYFTKWEGNPEDLRGRVKFYNAPKTCFDIWTAALLRDDKGDEDEPQAHGVFFDENAAFLFQLESLKQGKNNSYKTSKFITTDGIPIPMIGKKGEPNEKNIAKLLTLRHNLWDKIEVPTEEKIQRAFRIMSDGDDDDDDDGGFDDDETVGDDDEKEAKKDKGKSKDKAKDKVKKDKEEKAKDKAKKDKPKKDKPKDDEVVDDDDDAIVDDDDDLPDQKPVTDDEDFDSPEDDESDSDDADDDDADDADDDDDVGSSEIDALLNQLEDDDD